MHTIEHLRSAVFDRTSKPTEVIKLTNLLLLEIVERLEALQPQSLNAFDSDHADRQCVPQKSKYAEES